MSRRERKNDQPKKLWGGRFSEATNPAVEAFSASVHFDRALARYDLRGSIAHAQMLSRVGLVPERDAAEIVRGLQAIGQEIESGEFPFDPALVCSFSCHGIEPSPQGTGQYKVCCLSPPRLSASTAASASAVSHRRRAHHRCLTTAIALTATR